MLNMNKKILTFGAIGFLAGSLSFVGCKKDDTTPPEISLKGASTIEIDLGDTFTDPGTSASDDNDGDLSTKVTASGTVNNTQVGTYTITYSVSDEAGNPAADVTREVKVRSNKLAGTYAVDDAITGTYNGSVQYNVTVTQSSTAYNKINIQNFGGYGNSVTVYAYVEGTNITIPSQIPTGMPTTPVDITGTTISGASGTYNGGMFKITSVSYTAVYPNSIGADSGVATYTKQ